MKITILYYLSAFQILFLEIYIIQCENIVEPTLKPADPFSASDDAKYFMKQIQEDRIANRDKMAKIWFHRTFDQRAQISEYYNSHYCTVEHSSFGSRMSDGCPLENGLQDISHDNLDDLYSASFRRPEMLLARTAYEAMEGQCKEVGAIEEILCANDKNAKDIIAKYYEAHGKKLEDHLKKFRGDDSDYQNVMQQYCWKGFCQEKKIKPEDAEKEANALRAIDPDKDKDGFKKKLIELLDKNCEPDLQMIFQKYRTNKDCGIGEAVDKAFECKRVKRAYNRMVRNVEDTCRFYADELYEAMDGCGTNTDKINRIILSRCERNLGCILKKYKEFHGKDFTDRLKTDTLGEGRYRQSIRYLCGE